MSNDASGSFLLQLRKLGFALSPPGRSKLPRTLLRRLFRYINTTVRIDDFAGMYFLDVCLSEHMQRRIFWMGYYSEDIVQLLDNILAPGMTVIDVGANIGEISLFASKKVGADGQVIAFEPIDVIADKLENHIKVNRLAQVSVQRCALGDVLVENMPIYASCGQDTSDDHAGLGSIYSNGTSDSPLQNVQMTTLDMWLLSRQVNRLDVLKIDIEGAEFACLRGAVQCISQYRPKIIIEIQDFSAQRAGHKACDILDFLSGFDYGFHRIDKGGALSPLSSETLGDYQNVLCVPLK